MALHQALLNIIQEAQARGIECRFVVQEKRTLWAVIDFVRHLTGLQSGSARKALERAIKQCPSVTVKTHGFGGRGGPQAVVSGDHLISILTKLDSKYPRVSALLNALDDLPHSALKRPARVSQIINEEAVSDRLASEENGRREIRYLSGRADVVTSDELIEVKHWRQWKSAVGQVLVYSGDAHLKPRIHLFCTLADKDKMASCSRQIERHCHRLGIRVTYSVEHVDAVKHTHIAE